MNTPGIIAIYIVDLIFFLFSIAAFFLSTIIALKWNINSTSPLQYKLEKYAYLGSTIIKYIFAVKLPLFLFFIFTVDSLSVLIPGAMCGAGVIDATDFGTDLLVVKVISLYLFGFWLLLNRYDNDHEDLPFTRLKFILFIPLFIVFCLELYLEVFMFSTIDPANLVDCCGVIYSVNVTTYIASLFKMPVWIPLSIFYVNFFLLVLVYFLKRGYLYAILNIIFIIISILTLIIFFGTYIYELPTHHCPFCFLQKDYYYVGYLLYTTLFLGTFFGVSVPFFKKENHFTYSIVFNILYTFIVTAYPVVYFLKNGVWL